MLVCSLERCLRQDLADLLRLWYHESCRVYQDRLVNDDDRDWFKNLCKDKMKVKFNTKFDDVVTTEPLLYGDYMSGGVDNRPYSEMPDHAKVTEKVDEFLEDYNQISTAKMNLVMFMDAIVHLTRIARVIRQPMANALLLGMGGSGRQSLTRLAAHLSEYECYQIELSKNYGNNEWKDDLKRFMMRAGMENQSTVFLFSDTQIKTESFLEDINNILNSGDVPNLYAIDELDEIYTAMKPIVQDVGQCLPHPAHLPSSRTSVSAPPPSSRTSVSAFPTRSPALV